ncbi:hypothetical protein [Microbacterium invictum]|uniref:Uncharacterized protein n=1 Tax=Microbacterium invictum TaxID=515415 RepID=A0ABZ0V8U6_9MICO|nr:hypothetical protein [Microbacterium invictum]WQB69741.1 hypothetical protein T9R20_13710 [Microbacterium invictum]
MTELLASPILLFVSLGALGLAIVTWVISAFGISSVGARRRLRAVTAVAIAVALAIIVARFVVLGG